MATFTITRNGATYDVTVPPERADSITESELLAMIDGGGAAPAGQQPANPDTSFGGALRYGAGEAARGLGATARVAGNVLDEQGLRNIGEGLSGVLPADPNYQPATPQFIEGIRNMDRRALDYFPRAVVESVPSLLLTRGAGRVAGVPGMVASGVGQSAGNIAETRAQNDGRTPDQVTGTDAAIGLVGGLGIGALEAFGVRGAASSVGQRMANFGLTGRTRELGRSAAREGVSEMPEQAVQQIAESAGTQAGLQMDPAEIIAAGPLGAGARGATGAPGAAVRGAVESGARLGAERAMGDMSPDVAESVVRLNRLLEDQSRLFRERTGTDAPPEELFNASRGQLEKDLRAFVTRATRAGWLDDRAGEATAMRELVETAVRHNRAMVAGVPTDEFSMGEGLGRIDGLQTAPAEFRNAMRALLTDLDQLSRASRKNRMTGPFERIGDTIGRAGAVVGGTALGGPAGAIAGIAMAVGGNPLGARVGASVGRQFDRLMGTRQPAIVLAREKAERIVRQAGAESGNTAQIRDELNRLLNDDRLAERARLGLPTDADTMAREAAKAAEKAAKREAERQRRETESKLKAEAVAAQQEVADRERAWQDYETRFRNQGASPEEVQRILDAQRRAENARKAADMKRAAQELDKQSPNNLDAVTKSQIAEYEAFRAQQERQARAEQARQEAEARKQRAEAARKAADEQRAALAAIEAQITASERAADAAAAARRAAERKVEQQRLRDLERDAERAAKEAIEAQKEAEAEAAKAVEKAAQAEAVKTAKRRARKKPAPTPEPEPPPQAPGTPQGPLPGRPAPPLPGLDETPSTASQTAPEGPTFQDPEGYRGDAPRTDSKGPLVGWMAGVRTVLASKGDAGITRQEMLDALDRAVERGGLEEDIASVYRARMERMPRDLFYEVVGEAAEARGVNLDAADVDAGTVAQTGRPGTGGPDYYRPDVRDPASWQGTADARQAHMRFYQERAVERGDYDLAELLARFSTNSERRLDVNERKVLARAVVNAGKTEDQKGLRRAAMAPWLNGESFGAADPPAPSPPPVQSPEGDGGSSGEGAAVEAAARRARGRPKGTGKNQRAAAEAAASEAQTAQDAELLRMDVTDARLREVEARFNAAAKTLRAKIMEGDDKASDALDRITEQLQLARRANAVWRREAIEKGSMSD